MGFDGIKKGNLAKSAPFFQDKSHYRWEFAAPFRSLIIHYQLYFSCFY